MMKMLLMAISVLGVVSCTSTPSPSPVVVVGCAVEQAATGAFSASIAAALSCTNLVQMQADIQAALGKANLCAQIPSPTQPGHKKGVIGGVVCPIAVSAVMGIVNDKIPAAWGCTAGGSASAQALSAACVAAIPY